MDANNTEPIFNKDIINAVRFLYGTGKISKDKDIADAMHPYKKNTISSIINGKANAGPDFRTKFEEVFKVKLMDFITPYGFEQNETSIVNEHSPEYLTGKLIGKLEIKEEVIAQIDARRKDAEALAEKMERHYKDLAAALERAQATINEFLRPMATSLKEIPPVLETIVRNSNEHDKEIMKALDHLVGNSPGTLEKESGKRILKGALERQKKGKADVGKRG
jgi:plasmid maintenance system antidote protein VapI